MTDFYPSPRASRPYTETDVTEWEVLSDETLGTKPKRWLRDAGGDTWLMKDTTFSRLHDGSTIRKGDDWSERVACGVAEALGLPAARVELAFKRGTDERLLGVISRDMLVGADGSRIHGPEELIDGNELLDEPVTVGNRGGYTVEAVRGALNGVLAPRESPEGATAWDVFVGYLLLDAVIGNTDRHEENWAVISGPEGLRLAPTFDHASCLGFQLDDGQRVDRLLTRDRGYTPEAYADRARTPFAGQPHPVDVVAQALVMSATGSNLHWFGRCADIDALARPIWAIPAERMSAPAREFAERVLTRNCQRLLDGLA